VNLELFQEKSKDFLAFLEVERNASPHTLRAYSGDLRQLAKFWQKSSSREPGLSDSFDDVMRRFIVSLFYQKLSKPSLARKLSTMRSFRDFLFNQGIKINLNIQSPRIDKKLPVTLSVDEIFYLLDSIKLQDLPTKLPYRDKAIFEMIYATGIRCSEVVNIKINELSLENKLVKVMGKGRRERVVLFGSKARQSLLIYLEKERPNLLNREDQNYLFLNKAGELLTTRSVQRIFEMFRKLLKVNRKLTPHKIRHSFATHLLSEGVDLRIIQELLGHKTIATTEIYTHVTNQQLAKLCDEKHPLNNFVNLGLEDTK
jgi:site-specific recombinase XerD